MFGSACPTLPASPREPLSVVAARVVGPFFWWRLRRRTPCRGLEQPEKLTAREFMVTAARMLSTRER